MSSRLSVSVIQRGQNKVDRRPPSMGEAQGRIRVLEPSSMVLLLPNPQFYPSLMSRYMRWHASHLISTCKAKPSGPFCLLFPATWTGLDTVCQHFDRTCSLRLPSCMLRCLPCSQTRLSSYGGLLYRFAFLHCMDQRQL